MREGCTVHEPLDRLMTRVEVTVEQVGRWHWQAKATRGIFARYFFAHSADAAARKAMRFVRREEADDQRRESTRHTVYSSESGPS